MLLTYQYQETLQIETMSEEMFWPIQVWQNEEAHGKPESE